MSSENNAEKVFRDALQPSARHQESSYQTMVSKVFYSSFGWSILVFFIVFLMLFLISPPIVQIRKAENDLSKPRPDLFTIAVVSFISGLVVFICSKFIRPPSVFL